MAWETMERGEKGGGKEAEIVRTAIALFSSSVQMSCRVVISVRSLGEEERGGRNGIRYARFSFAH